MKRCLLFTLIAGVLALSAVSRLTQQPTTPPRAGTAAAATAIPRQKPLQIPAQPPLPSPLNAQWAKPSPLAPMAAFQEWTAQYAARPDTEKAAQGVKLAQDRRTALRALIQKDPEQALASAVPETVRRALPAEVRSLLEEKVDARGDLINTAATPSGGCLPAGKRAVRRQAQLNDGRRMEAFVYGNREYQPSRADVPIHGIALDGALAVSQWPGRVLEPVEREEAKKALAEEPVCPTSGAKVSETGTETVVLTGDTVRFYCGPAHAESVLQEEATAEALLPPGLGVRDEPHIVAASGGAGQTVSSPLSEGDHEWTTGTKRMLVVRVKFPVYGGGYYDYSHLTDADCSAIVDRISAAFNDWSYGRLVIRPVESGGSKISPYVLLDDRAEEYEGDDVGDIWDEVEDKVEDDHNIDPDNYDYILVLGGNAPLTDEEDETKTVWWSGLGRIGEGLSFIRVGDVPWDSQKRIDTNVSVSLHELGHNLGLYHSSNIFTVPQMVDGSLSTGEEYGDRYDRMGRGGGEGRDFNVRYKQWLNWLDNGNVPYAVTDGVYTIHEHDYEEKSGVRGLQVAPEDVFIPITGATQLFIEYRLNNITPASDYPYVPKNDTLAAYGAEIRTGQPGGPKTWLMDTTPETPNWEPVDAAGNLDSLLLPGRTYAFSRGGKSVYITNLNADPDTGELQVEIQHGPISGNSPPGGSITANTPQGAQHQKIIFTADATDPQDTDLSYHWQIPLLNQDAAHPAIFPNARSITVQFPAVTTYTVKCIVSDKHGGVVTMGRTYNVVVNQPPSISAISDRTTEEDAPIYNIPFTVSDPTTPANELVVTATSSNIYLFPAGSITYFGTGGSRTVTLTPPANRHGQAKITLAVSDGGLQDVEEFNVTVTPVTPGVTLVSIGNTWRYWDQHTAPPGDWKAPGYDDSTWGNDTAVFVYPAPTFNLLGWTVLRPDFSRPACYFRKVFVEPLFVPTGTTTLKFLCDDGLVVYINGVEVWRHNMPDGPVTSRTRAASSVEGAKQSQWVTVPLSGTPYHAGANTIAVEVHDYGATRGGSDVRFDMQVAVLQTPTVSSITDKTSPEDQQAGGYGFTASEYESPSGPLTYSAVSSNQELVQDSSFKFGYNFITSHRTISCTPQPNATGTTEVTLKVSDGSSETWEKFNLTITPVNDAPVLQPVPDLAVALGELAPLVEIQVSDVDNDPAALTVSAVSSNNTLLPTPGIQVLPGTAPNRRWLRLNPNASVAAQSNITVTVSDGSATSSDVFIFRVSYPVSTTSTDVSLVHSGEIWRYWADALPLGPRGQPVDFTTASLDDRAWPYGASRLGYGGDGEVTPVPIAPHRITTYFRRKFTVPNAAVLSQLKLRMIRDDAAAVYLNGALVWSSNFTAGVTITPGTPAATDISGVDEDAWQSFTISSEGLISGSNTLAVEVHQRVMPSVLGPGDLSFDFEMDGVPVAATAPDVLVAPGEMWSYWDQSSYPDNTWRLATYAEEGWKKGLARLGYGLGGESTVVNKDTPNGFYRNPSVLFRKVFHVADPAAYSALHLFTERDDGIAVHLNGVRVHYENVSATSVPGDFALSEIPAPQHFQWHHYLIDPKRLLAGGNLLAVEIHQSSLTGSDLNFDLQLTGELTGVPPLHMTPDGANWQLAWPAAYNGWQLRSSTNLSTWSNVAAPPLLDGAWIYVMDPAGGARRYYRLEKP